MKNSFDEKILEEANDWIKANQKVVLATVIQTLLAFINASRMLESNSL